MKSLENVEQIRPGMIVYGDYLYWDAGRGTQEQSGLILDCTLSQNKYNNGIHIILLTSSFVIYNVSMWNDTIQYYRFS